MQYPKWLEKAMTATGKNLTKKMSCMYKLIISRNLTFFFTISLGKSSKFFETGCYALCYQVSLDNLYETVFKNVPVSKVEILYGNLGTNGPCVFFIDFEQFADDAITA